jgi:hypothetical protein
VSPRNLLVSTAGDELVIHSGGRSRVFSVSIKDRGAILPGGHTGKAFWLSRRRGEFVTSSYYYDDVPSWATAWNERRLIDGYKEKSWELLLDEETYNARDRDDRPYEASFDTLGRTFPHSFGDGSSRYFTTLVSLSPMGDELTLDFARTLVDRERLGQGDSVDYLAVSFSSPDYAGHLFGQASLEYEDAVLRLDRLLAELFEHIDRHVGLARTLIVLSADHGGVEAPEYVTELGLEAGRHPLDWFRRDPPLTSALRERFGRDDFIAGHSHPYLYLDADAIEDAALDIGEVEQFVAAEMVKLPGIAHAVSRIHLEQERVGDTVIGRMVRRSFHPERSGHIHLVPDQYWFLHSTEEAEKMGVESLAAIHGSPWAYDTHVPIMIAGPGVPRLTVHRRVGPEDIAATIITYLGTKLPSGASGELLFETLGAER